MQQTREKRIVTPVNAAEESRIQARAQAAGFTSTAAYMRDSALKTEAVPTVFIRSERPPCSPGEYATTFFRAFVHKDAEAVGQLEGFMRAAGDETAASQITGVIPTLIVGDLIKFVDANRYAFNACRNLPMPQAGSAFKRPRVTATTTVGSQSSELSALSAQSMTLTGDSVSKATAGGFVHVSEQAIDWSDPAFLQIVIEDLAEQYAIDTESVATSAISSGATNTVNPGGSSGTKFDDTAAHFIPTIASAISTCYGTAKKQPDVLFCDPVEWGKLLGLVDTTGRPLFPTIGAFNAPGTIEVQSFNGNPMSLKLVVSPEFSSGFMAVGVSRYCEVYEQNKGLAQLTDPTHMGLNIAYRGYVASNVYANGLCKLVNTP